MSSALRNAVKRKTHKERAQPAARRKYGLLEKKKDYLLRAKDFHKKEQAIQVLRRKAEERNPDEFYFSMQNTRTSGGVHAGRSEQGNKYTADELRLMKTQDVAYINLKTQSEAKRVERLKSNLHFIGARSQNSHTVFVDDETAAASFSPARHFDTPEDLVIRTYNRPRVSQLQSQSSVSISSGASQAAHTADRKRTAAYRELLQRSERQQKLGAMAQQMAYQKEVMGKGRKRKLSQAELGSSGTVFKWKPERKK